MIWLSRSFEHGYDRLADIELENLYSYFPCLRFAIYTSRRPEYEKNVFDRPVYFSSKHQMRKTTLQTYMLYCCIALIAHAQSQLYSYISPTKYGDVTTCQEHGIRQLQDRIFVAEDHGWRRTVQHNSFSVIKKVQVMDLQSRVCVLHLPLSGQQGDVKPFDDEVWGKVQVSNIKRKEKPLWCTSKYAEVCQNLKDTYADCDGYHTQCYKNFTAVAMDTQNDTSSTEKSVFLRSESASSEFLDKCLFCNKNSYRRSGNKFESVGTCESKDAEAKIRDAAINLSDSELLAKISNIDFISRKVKYHHTCRRAYLHRAENLTLYPTKSSKLNRSRDKALTKITDYVVEHVIIGKQAETLTSIHSKYQDFLRENNCPVESGHTHFLGQQLLKQLEGKIEIGKLNNKQGNCVYPVGMDTAKATEQASSADVRIQETALYLRSLILEMKQSYEDFPYPLTAEYLTNEMKQPPAPLLTFFRVLITGSTDESTERVERYTESMASDCLFTTTKGTIKPQKHVCLGLGLKSLTGSRKVIEILNHYGHCLSYHNIEALETDLAMSASDKHSAMPTELASRPDLCTGIAWDNYDHNTETLSGADTLHDTVGICYQNIPDQAEFADSRSDDMTLQTKNRRVRKRTFDTHQSSNIEPYRKKPKITKFDYKVKDDLEPQHIVKMKRRDQTWTLSCQLFQSSPMWIGWNAGITHDILPQQVIGYLENISLPPTRLDVVAETLRISQSIAKECRQEYAIVHYDLAIAKPAKQIQVQESPKYDNVFICFGPFHIQLAYFGSLGYLLEESGGPHILTDSNVLGSGSLNGFLRGKHYNRCKRLHPMLFQAVRLLHLKQFLEVYQLPEALNDQLRRLSTTPSTEHMEQLEQMEEYSEMMTRYEEYLEKTRGGEHGKTAQFWIHYTDLVQLYLLFSRACHTNDLELFTYCVGQMAVVFFATSRPNYSRWMVKYHLDLLNMDETHPGIRETLKQGALTIRRTSKPFSRAPVDLTLEQTVNADAASRRVGITQFSSSLPARRRWMATHSIRSKIASFMMTKAGLSTNEGPVQETKPSRVKRDRKDLESLIEGISNTMSPFRADVEDEELYCISTGKAMPKDIANDMTAVMEKGKLWMDEFKQDCFADASRFEKPIKRRKVKNFAQAAVSSTITSKDKKVRELKCSRDLFGRLLYLATEMEIDMTKVFKYPLTPVPLAISHVDGTLLKTDKSKLMRKLESKIVSVPPVSTDVTIVDAMFYIQSQAQFPATFGGIAKMLLAMLTKLSSRVDFVADTYKSPSIKDCERISRGTGCATKITGPEQRRPNDFQKAMKSAFFKESLLEFLSEEWKKDVYATLLGTCKLYFGFANSCLLYEASSGKTTSKTVAEMACIHEEADTRIVWHLTHCTKEEGCRSVVVRSSDTDVLVVLLFHSLAYDVSLWMDVGNSGTNSRRFINIKDLRIYLGAEVCRALPGLHAFTGCDYTAAFSRKGKIRPFEIALKSNRYLDAFGNLGESHEISDKTSADMESFVCSLYGKPSLASVNDTRYSIFRTKYAPSTATHPLAKLKGADPSLLPPSKPVLHQKLLRSNLVAHTWKNAHRPVACEMNPSELGWTLDDGKYKPLWYAGPQLPENVCQDIHRIDTINSEIEEECDNVAESDSTESSDDEF